MLEANRHNLQIINTAADTQNLFITVKNEETDSTISRQGDIHHFHREFCLERARFLTTEREFGGKITTCASQAEIDNLFFVAKHPRDISRMRKWPFTHQVIDMESVIINPFYFIASEMRTGKTKICIDAAQFLFELGIIDNVIVVAPAPVKDVWFDVDLGELQKHIFKNFLIEVLEYHANFRGWGTRTNKTDKYLHWTITNYEFIRSENRIDELLQFCSPKTLLLCDESSFIKNYAAKQTKAVKKLRELCGRVALINGTPITQSPLDLFSQGNILDFSILECDLVTHFKAKYAILTPILGYGAKPLKNKWGGTIQEISGWTNLPDLQHRFAPYTVRRLQAECLDLPPKLDPVTLAVPLDPPNWKIYRQMRDECVVMFEGATNASIAAQAVTKAIRLGQITSGFLGGIQNIEIEDFEENLDMGERPEWMEHGLESKRQGSDSDGNSWSGDDRNNSLGASFQRASGEGTTDSSTPSGAVREIGREKLDLVLWFLRQGLEQDPNLHIVVWCRFRPELFRMTKEVALCFPQFTMGTIHGGQKKADRLYAMSLLKPETSPKGPVFVDGTYGTGSYGLDFTAAHTNLNCSYDSSVGKFKQSGDRVYGPGQTQPVAYFDIQATGPKGQKTIDHHIIMARRNNENIADWTAAYWVKVLTDE